MPRLHGADGLLDHSFNQLADELVALEGKDE
jgi:hypothetical protein